MAKINLTRTQNGYVPLEDRRKSFPADSENTPSSDNDFYFENYANGTLEHATLDLLYPPPQWLKNKLLKQKSQFNTLFRVTTEKVLRATSNGLIRISREEK